MANIGQWTSMYCIYVFLQVFKKLIDRHHYRKITDNRQPEIVMVCPSNTILVFPFFLLNAALKLGLTCLHCVLIVSSIVTTEINYQPKRTLQIEAVKEKTMSLYYQ